MRIFLAFFFSLSLMSTAFLPTIAYLLDDAKVINIGTITEEEEKKEVKLEVNLKDLLFPEARFLSFMDKSGSKISRFGTDALSHNIYMDIFLPPPQLG